MADEVVVTATRVAEKRSMINQNVTVITAEDIARSGQQTLAELLQMQGGSDQLGYGAAGCGVDSRHSRGAYRRAG